MALVLARHWWTLALRGILAMLFGILALALPGITLWVLVLLFGTYSLITGLLALGVAITAHQDIRHWVALLLEGLVGVAIGLVTFFWPGVTAIVLLWLIASWAILTGILQIGTAIQMRRLITGEWLLVMGGALSIVLGIALIASPTAGVLALVWMIGAYALVFGVVMVVLAVRLRSIRHMAGKRPLKMS